MSNGRSERDLVEQLKRIRSVLRKRIEASRDVGLRVDPATGQKTLSKDTVDTIAKYVQKRVNDKMAKREYAATQKLMGRYYDLRNLALPAPEQVPGPRTPTMQQLRGIRGAEESAIGRSFVDPLRRYPSEHKAIINRGRSEYRDWLKTQGFDEHILHRSYRDVLGYEAPRRGFEPVGPKPTWQREIDDIRANLAPQYRGNDTMQKMAKRFRDLDLQRIETKRGTMKQALREAKKGDKLVLIGVYDRLEHAGQEFPTTDPRYLDIPKGTRVTQEGGLPRYYEVADFDKIKNERVPRMQTIPYKERVEIAEKEGIPFNKTPSKRRVGTDTVPRFEPLTPKRTVKESRTFRSPELGPRDPFGNIIIESQPRGVRSETGEMLRPLTFERVERIDIPPERVLKEGQWRDVEYKTIHARKTQRKYAGVGKDPLRSAWNKLDDFERIFWETNAKQVHANPSMRPAIQDYLRRIGKKKLTGRDWMNIVAQAYSRDPGIARRPEFARAVQNLEKLIASKRFVPPAAKIAVGAIGAGLGLAYLLGNTEEATASPLGDIARGVAVRGGQAAAKAVFPGYKRNDWSHIEDRKKREEFERIEDEIEAVHNSARYKFGRDFFGSVFAQYIGEKWAGQIWGDFEPNIAGVIVGEIPKLVVGGKLIGAAIKSPTFAAKIARSFGTGVFSRSIPQAASTLHGDTTVGEAALSTLEEGIWWGATDAIMKPLGGAAKYFVGVGKWRPDVVVTPEIAQGVERSLLTKMMTFWPEKIGGPAWDGLVKMFRRIPGFDNLLVPATRRMHIETRRAMEDGAAEMGINLDAARMLYEKALLNLKRHESHFASDVFREVPVVSKSGKNLAMVDILRNPDLRKFMRQYGVTKDRAGQIIHNHLQPVRRAFIERGAEAVAEDLLRQATYFERLQTYFPRLYWPKELLEYEQATLTNPFVKMSRKLRLKLQRFAKLHNIPNDLLEKMDMINDFSYITWKGLRDVSISTSRAKMFRRVSEMPESFSFGTRKVPKPTVLAQAGITEEQFRNGAVLKRTIKFPTKERVFQDRDIFIRYEPWMKENKWAKVPREKEFGIPVFGKLHGGWVEPAVMDSLKELARRPGKAEMIFSKIMSKWKYGKVVLRPATQVRNFISNVILNDLGGLPFWKLHRYAESARMWKQKGNSPYYREIMTTPIGTSRFVTQELAPSLDEPTAINKFLTRLGRGGGEQWVDRFHKAYVRFRQAARVPSHTYDMVEKIAKGAKYIDNRKKGMAIREAAEDAMKWTFNYGEITPFVRTLRTTAMPFATFTYKAIPIIAESVIKHPLRFAKWPLMAIGMTGFALDKLDVSNEEWNWVKRVLPEYMRTGHFILIPYRDEHNRLQFMDLTYILPWGDIAELAQQGLLRLIQNPVATLAMQLAQNRNFYGQPIYHEWEQNNVKVLKVMNHIWRQMMPSWTPDLAGGTNPELVGGFDWHNLVRAVRQDTEDPPTMKQAVLSSLGLKIRPIDPSREAGKRKRSKKWKLREAKAYYKRVMRNTNDPEAMRGIVERRIKALEKIKQDKSLEFMWKVGRFAPPAGNPLASEIALNLLRREE